MKKQLTIICLLLALVSFIPAANSQEKRKEGSGIRPIEIELADEAAIVIGGMRITLSDAIKTAIDRNHDILTGKYDVAMTDSYSRQYDTKYSPFLSAEGGYTSKDYPELMYSEYGSHRDIYDLSASLSKMFSTGTTLTFGVQDSHTTFKNYGIDKSYSPVLFVNIQQELLKNIIGYSERREKKFLRTRRRYKRTP